MEKCKNCSDEIQKVLIGNKKDYWHSNNLLKVGASMDDCECGCSNPEPNAV